MTCFKLLISIFVIAKDVMPVLYIAVTDVRFVAAKVRARLY